MSSRIIELSSEKTHLSVRHSQLVISIPNTGERQVPLEDIGLVIINTPSASLSHAVITRLAEQKAAIIHCAHNQMPVSLSLPFSANTLQGERLRAQTDLSKPRQKRLWQQIITTKIKLQAAVLLSVRQDSFGLDKMALRVASGTNKIMKLRPHNYTGHACLVSHSDDTEQAHHLITC